MSTTNLTPGQAAIIEGTLDAPPSRAATQSTGTATANVKSLSDSELASLINTLLSEQQERAVDAADPEALIQDGFNQLFNRNGEALEPEIVAGILVCAGSLRNVSTTTHVCSFVHIDDHWCWDHPDSLEDEVRKIPANGREHQRSITLVPVTEGTKIDFVTSKMTPRDGHKAKKSVSYIVANGALEVTNTRSAPQPGPGR